MLDAVEDDLLLHQFETWIHLGKNSPKPHFDENDSATMRGRMPAHDSHRCRKMLLDSLLVECRRK